MQVTLVTTNTHEFDIGKFGVHEVSHLVRLYNSVWVDGAGTKHKANPYYCPSGPDKRLSSRRYGINIGYWAPNLVSCFQEVFLRKGEGEFAPKSHYDVSLSEQQLYKVCKIRVPKLSPLCLVPLDGTDSVCRSAIYSDQPEKDEFVRHCYEHDLNYDGIIYRSNHNPSLECFALFERSVKKIESAISLYQCKDEPLGNFPKDMLDIISTFPKVSFEVPD